MMMMMMMIITGLLSVSFHYNSKIREKGSHNTWEMMTLLVKSY